MAYLLNFWVRGRRDVYFGRFQEEIGQDRNDLNRGRTQDFYAARTNPIPLLLLEEFYGHLKKYIAIINFKNV